MSKNNKFINVDETTSDILLEGIVDQKKMKQKITKLDVSNSIRDNNDTEFKNIAVSDNSNNSLNLIKEDNENSSNSSKSKRKYVKKNSDKQSVSSQSSKSSKISKSSNIDIKNKTNNIFDNKKNIIDDKKNINNNNNDIDKASVSVAKTFLLFIIQFIEFVNNRYDPLGLDLDGWSNQLNNELDNHNEILYKILQKYKGNTETEPEIQLLMAIVMSGVTFHFSKTLNKGISNIFQMNSNNNDTEKKNNININIKKNENKKIIEDLKNKVGINMDYSSYTE